MAEGIVVPISTPGADKAAQDLNRVSDALGKIGDGATKSAFSFNQIRQALTSAISDVNAFAESVTALASEQAQLNANSARLGLNFDEAAEAAGRFTDETEAMTAATRLAESGIRLSQNELNSLTRVAAAFAQNTGVTTREAVDTLTQGLITGSERGLRPFGGELRAAAGETHTITDRLAALAVQAGHTTQATDDAASSFARFKDSIEDSQRTLASGFAEGITEMQNAARAAREASGATDSWTDHLRELGQAAGVVAAFVAASFNLAFEAVRYTAREIGSEVTLLARMIAHPTQAGSLRAGMTATRAENRRDLDLAVAQIGALDIFGDRGRRTAAPGALPATSRGAADMVFTTEELTSGSARRSGGRGARSAEDDKTAKTAEMAADEARRAQQALDERTSREKRAAQEADARAELQLERDTAAAKLEIQKNELEEERRNSLEARRERASLQRQEEAAARRATLADLRDPAVQREQLDAARMERTIARERRALDRRADQQQTFTERMRDYYHSDVSAAEEAATGLQGAFQATGEAFAAHVEEFAAGRETMAEALQGMAADALKSIGKQALTKAAYFFAEGLGNLALLNFPGATTAFAASAAYAAIGGGAIAIGTEITEPPEAKKAGREEAARKAEQDRTKPQRAETGTGSRGGKGGEGAVVYNISFGGPMYGTGGVRQAARQMVGAINRGGIQGGVQLLPGVLQGAGAGT